jgi:hypothetical protein
MGLHAMICGSLPYVQQNNEFDFYQSYDTIIYEAT